MSPSEPARCSVELLPVRAEPSDGAEQVTQLVRDEPVCIEERRGDWTRVRTGYDYPGWVRADGLAAGTSAHASSLEPSPGADPVAEAQAFLGSPYEWGGMTERGIDCSGLVHMAFRRAGRVIPRDAHQQEAAGEPVPADDLRPGDLVTYGGPEGADHIAFWLGGGRILHATGRDGVNAVVEEAMPLELAARVRRYVRF